MADMKQYIISFQATLKGHQMVMSQLKGMEANVKRVTDTTGKAGQVTQSFDKVLAKAGRRALIVAPVWLLIRSAMMSVIRTVSEAIQAFKDFDDQLARIRTVMHGDAQVIEAEMVAIRSQILKTAKDSRISLKDLTEGFYFLKTSNLDAREAMAAFEHTVNLATGTNNAMGQSARAVAGVYNTMGKYLGDNLTVHEKFQKIADVLAYTYSTQDVQLSELIESYTKLAPYVTGLSDNFTELTTMLGFLNTRLLRGGRTGRLTGRAILQLTKNAQKLANTFGITFKGDEPIHLLNTIKQIREALNSTGKVTAEQGQIIQEVFATRGGVAIRLLIEHFEDLDEEIQGAIENADGFAQKMKDIRMGTIAGQMERMKNIMALLATEFITGAYGTKDLAETLKLLGDSLLWIQPLARFVGEMFGYMGNEVRKVGEDVIVFSRVIREVPKWKYAFPGLAITDIGIRGQRMLDEMGRKSFSEYVKSRKESTEAEAARLKAIETLRERETTLTRQATELYQKGEMEKAKAVEERIKRTQKAIMELMPAEVQYQNLLVKKEQAKTEADKIRIGFLDKITEETKHQIKLMKSLGVSSLDIARYELERLENMEIIADEREHELNLLKARNKVIQEEYNYRKEIVDTIQETEVTMLKVMGASELQILDIKEEQLKAEKELIGETSYLTRLADLRLQRQIALQKEKEKELDTATNLYMAYEKAEGAERERIRQLMELIELSPRRLVSEFESGMFNKRIIMEYWSYFSDEQQRAIGESIRSMRGLTKLNLPTPRVPGYKRQLLTGDIKEQLGKLEIVPTIGEINVNLPEGSLDNMAELVGRQVTEKLRTDETLQKALAKLLRPYL
jgi:TP901 family phage tail tape measure protein